LVSGRRHPEGGAASELKDESDRANAALSTELSLLQRNQAEALLKAINTALDRIKAGSYGLCLNCEQEIALKRLDAVPWASFCITCQELIDDSGAE
jgi:DnaK suppressor protein